MIWGMGGFLELRTWKVYSSWSEIMTWYSLCLPPSGHSFPFYHHLLKTPWIMSVWPSGNIAFYQTFVLEPKSGRVIHTCCWASPVKRGTLYSQLANRYSIFHSCDWTQPPWWKVYDGGSHYVCHYRSRFGDKFVFVGIKWSQRSLLLLRSNRHRTPEAPQISQLESTTTTLCS